MSTASEPPPPSSRLSQAEIMAGRRRVYAARNRALLMYSSAAIIGLIGLTYASSPLYRAFCAATGFAGTPQTGTGKFAPERLVPASEAEGVRRIKVNFNADKSDALPWGFFPQQKFVYVVPGQTALAFYSARNKGDEDIIGIATYSVAPAKAAPYFAKVECFCFEEQKLLAGEEVDLPLFFFIDKDFLEDPLMRDVNDIVLSYTFFKARRNQRGHLEPDASEAVVQKSLGWADYEHVKASSKASPPTPPAAS
ncbi:hypothetical protein EXIGLDRAFT_608055 [Exidia glandulosa HHB12029]|uniref:Cytochrome oxidase assembly factor n=1 Tax=Exidia glandulosa HHB12029 TaxID=1314781 RepID=A0A165L7T3_EXIGL|nr:hypothetical protein EXIGLDRAFT_608055 [Exidia glandulosa HHB12029]